MKGRLHYDVMARTLGYNNVLVRYKQVMPFEPDLEFASLKDCVEFLRDRQVVSGHLET
jgi:hypothetical protein